MTREIVEAMMIDKVRELIDIYKEYNPEGDYLSISMFIKDDYINIHNSHWEKDIDAPVDISVCKED